MSLFVTSLNSGSNGNCYYIGNDSEAVLVDAGLSCRETEKRMQRLSLTMSKIKAVFISHEHSDHIAGIAVLARKYQLPVYITAGTHFHSGIYLETALVKPLLAFMPVQVGSLTITAFPKLHDAAEPCSFIIKNKEITIGVFTDIGAPCEHVIKHFKECHAAFLEANYDEVMLEGGSYPYHLKNRIRGGKGHLSNKQALMLFTAHKPPFMSHLFLSHLSKNNNRPELVESLFRQHAGSTQIIIAGRYKETAVYCIANTPVIIKKPELTFIKAKSRQLSLF